MLTMGRGMTADLSCVSHDVNIAISGIIQNLYPVTLLRSRVEEPIQARPNPKQIWGLPIGGFSQPLSHPRFGLGLPKAIEGCSRCRHLPDSPPRHMHMAQVEGVAGGRP